MSDWYSKVLEFQKTFNHMVSEQPTALDTAERVHRFGFMLEELQEFLVADSIPAQADAMVDLIYFALGTLVGMGVDPNPIFEIVHDANMQKLWHDGKPRYRPSDGKVVKPPNWLDPWQPIVAEIARQAALAIDAELGS